MFVQTRSDFREGVAQSETLERPEGEIRLTPTRPGWRRLTLHPRRPMFIARPDVETTYAADLIHAIAQTIGFGWIADQIGRDEAPDGNELHLTRDVLAFVPREWFNGRRLLDYGCGSGASTCAMGRLLPGAAILGVELSSALLPLAEKRAAHHGLSSRVHFEPMPNGTELPSNLGSFDAIFLNAVVEHLLPGERRTVLPLLWHHLRPGGLLFVNQTPHRWFPVEAHSTGLPLINYLPPTLALPLARWRNRYETTVSRSSEWSDHLRGGVRGTTERELLRLLGAPRGRLLPPCHYRDRVDAWYAALSPRLRLVKHVARWGLKAVYRATGTVLTPYLAIAVQKPNL